MNEDSKPTATALETLIVAQKLIISYSRKEMFNFICWGILMIVLAITSRSSVVFSILNLVLAGVNFTWAVKEYDWYNKWKADLEVLEEMNAKNETN